MRILLLDNYDSFVYNLKQYVGELGPKVTVMRNDAIDLDGIHERLARLTNTPEGVGELAAAPDGNSFAYTAARDGKVEVCTVSFDGTKPQAVK